MDSPNTKVIKAFNKTDKKRIIVLGAQNSEPHITKFIKSNNKYEVLCITKYKLNNHELYNDMQLILDFNKNMDILQPLWGTIDYLIFDSSTTKFWNKDLKTMLPLLSIGGKFFVQNMSGVYMLQFRVKDGIVYTKNPTDCYTQKDVYSSVRDNWFFYNGSKIDISTNTQSFDIDKPFDKAMLINRFKGQMRFGHGFCYESYQSYGGYKVNMINQDINNIVTSNKLLINCIYLDGLRKGKVIPLNSRKVKETIMKRINKGKLPKKLIVDDKINFQFDMEFCHTANKFPIKNTFMEVNEFFIITRKW